MKTTILVGALLVAAIASAHAQFGRHNSNSLYGGSTYTGGYGTGSNSNSVYVSPHYNSNGGFTSGHYQTAPNNTQLDNYGTRGNYNPYTGNVGTRSPRY
jgi:hypothetical protein